MKTAELFCGTKSFSKVAAARGHRTFTLDNEARFEADVTVDIRSWDPKTLAGVDILWTSPPCQGFSVAVIGRNWNRDHTPKTDSARLSMQLVERTIAVIDELKPRWWFIENPRAMLRKLPMMAGFRRVTVTYCQYGDTRMKPTDIWTNVPPEVWSPRPHCRQGMTCHEAAPRGSQTGTQGLKGAAARGAIPPALFEEILAALERADAKTV